MGTKAQLQAYLDSQDGHVGGERYWQYVYGWSGGGLPYCVVGMDAAFKYTDTECNYYPSTVAFDNNDRGIIGPAYRDRWNLEYLDAISFDWDGDGVGDHVGFFIGYLGDGKCRTFEFNVSNTAAYRTRDVSQIICGIRPRYSGEKSGKLVVDGVFGSVTCRALQEALQRHGYYKGYLLDGEFGHYTKLALQNYLRKLGYYGTYWLLDGDFGKESVKALQTYLRKLGYTDSIVDGWWRSLTTKALQKALNDGRF